MDGVFIDKISTGSENTGIVENGIKLLAKCDDMEIMEQSVVKGAVVWLTPAELPDTVEFFFIHSGEIEMSLDSKTKTLGPGECFTLKGLKKEIIVSSKSDAHIIYISNRPMFAEAKDFETYLRDLLSMINDKDHYTFQHSMNVMNYAISIFNMLDESEKTNGTQLNDIIVASLFHDVGKYYVPDAILKKSSKLNSEETRIIMHHPFDSGRMLRKYYGDRIAEIAENHHERMNGTGYPFGLHGTELSIEARILAVVDAFDAMTTNRGYNRVKSYKEAAEELYNLPDLFDHRICGLLIKLTEEGHLNKEQVKDGQ